MNLIDKPPRWYAGIGSGQVPKDVARQMTRTAARLEALGFGLRSGAATGADSAFEAGVASTLAKQIFLPWKGFNGHASSLHQVNHQAMKIARLFHPAFDQLLPSAKSLMARNSFQILGPHLNDPVCFVLCWTPDGCEHADDRSKATGDTEQAISIASAYGIPIFNLQQPSALERLGAFLRRQGWAESDIRQSTDDQETQAIIAERG